MACCVIIAMMFAPFLFVIRKLSPRRSGGVAWRAHSKTPIVQKKFEGFNINNRLASFVYAFEGVKEVVLFEQATRIHMAASLVLIVGGIYFSVDANEWRWLILAICLAWSAETMNTAIERLCDVVSSNFDPGIKVAKDLAAGAVLFASLASLAIGLTVFWPHVF